LPKKSLEPAPTAQAFFGELIGEERLDVPTTAITQKKKAAPRSKSKASTQKMLNEAEKTSKQERESTLKSQQQAQAEEMALIMAKIDVTSKSATSAFRRKKS